jgi:hypothetical protein
VIARDNATQQVVGYCQVSRGNESWSLDLIVHPVHRYDSLEIAPDLIRTALSVVSTEGGGHVHWWVFEPNNIHRQLAAEVGLHQGRRLLQLRRSLPLPQNVLSEIADFESCAFRVGIDEAELYGYWEHKDGSEGGGLWFERLDNGQLDLIDYDGDYMLPMLVIAALRASGVSVDADFE